MSDAANALPYAVPIGVAATAMLDLWSILRWKLGGTRPDYAPVGRWIGHMARGRFRHESMAAAAPITGERVIGWTAHYLVGIAFASVLLGIWGVDWLRHPTIGPALLVGIGSVAAPFLLMQPGMGAGVAASRTPNPAAARLRSVVTHAIFGLGLYLAACAASVLLRG